MNNYIEGDIRSFIEDNFLFRTDRADLSNSESLIEAGLVDSTGILELVAYLENRFALTVDDGEIIPENLDSVEAITTFVRRKLERDAAPREETTTADAGRAIP